MVQGRDRRVELGYQWAIELRKNIIYPPKNKNSKFNPVPSNNFITLFDSKIWISLNSQNVFTQIKNYEISPFTIIIFSIEYAIPKNVLIKSDF